MRNDNEKFYLRIFDDNHPNDWKFFFVCIIICNAIYFLVLNRIESENNELRDRVRKLEITLERDCPYE